MPSLRQLRDHLNGIDHNALAAHLQDYNYPRSSLRQRKKKTGLGDERLDIFMEVVEHDTQDALDTHHHELLTSDDDKDLIAGYLSVLYWGFLAYNPNLALTRVQHSLHSITENGSPNDIIEAVRDGVRHAERLDFYTAVERFCTLPQISFSFATKLCAFSNPDNAGVLDSVINDHYAIGLKMNSSSKVNRMTYQCYCELLTQKASQLGCRAIYVERALYAAALQP